MRSLAAAALALLLAATALGGCGRDAPPEIRVFAASSLTAVLGRLAADYEKETGTKVVLNLASSSTLAHQIVEGAPCDLFLSADEEWVEFTRSRMGGLDGGVLLTNRLVIVLAQEDPWEGASVHIPRSKARAETDLRRVLMDARIRRIAVGDPDHVPAGKYARAGLESIGLWEECQSRLVSCESVRAALALVKAKEADAGIVYLTDAISSGLPVAMLIGVPGSEDKWRVRRGDVFTAAEFPGVEARTVAYVPPQAPITTRHFLHWLRLPEPTAAFRAAGFGIPGKHRR